MWKVLFFNLILLIVIGFSVNVYMYILQDYMHINKERAQILYQTIEQELSKYPEFSTLDILCLMGIETNGKNIFGDHNKAIGYFQLHKEAIYYVWSYYPELGREKFISHPIKNLIYFPKLQVRLSLSYLHLLYLRTHDKEKAIAWYNGDKYNTNHYYTKFLSYKKYILALVSYNLY